MLCCPAPLILHPLHHAGFSGGAVLHGCAVFHLFPPLIREAVSLDLALPLLSLRLASLLSAVTCQQCSGRLCLSLVSVSILITLDLAPLPPLAALVLLCTATLKFALGLPVHRAGRRCGEIQ